jgi:hypothetical protein
MSTASDDDRRFQELNKKLEEKLSSAPKDFANTIDSHLRATKKDAIDQLDKAIKENNIPAALFYQAQIRWLKLTLREY